MPFPLVQTHGAFTRGKKTQSANTVIVQGVPPMRPQFGAPAGAGSPSVPIVHPGVAHVTDFVYQVGTTAHVITVMRPLNYTTFSADAAAAQAVVNLTADPGKYSTNYNYPLPNAQAGPSAANNLIAASDYVMYAAAAGQWVVDTVASVSALAITLTTNLPTGGVKAGGLFYFFGITTDTDPATNEAHQQFDVLAAASATAMYTLQSQNGIWMAHHSGDPILLHSSNATTAGTFELVAGYYAKH